MIKINKVMLHKLWGNAMKEWIANNKDVPNYGNPKFSEDEEYWYWHSRNGGISCTKKEEGTTAEEMLMHDFQVLWFTRALKNVIPPAIKAYLYPSDAMGYYDDFCKARINERNFKHCGTVHDEFPDPTEEPIQYGVSFIAERP